MKKKKKKKERTSYHVGLPCQTTTSVAGEIEPLKRLAGLQDFVGEVALRRVGGKRPKRHR